MGVIDDALDALARGEVVAVPTDTVYGVAVDPTRPGAAERLFAAKRRPRTVELPVLCSTTEIALSLTADVPAPAHALMARHWPGPLTIVLRRRPGLDLDLGSDQTTVGVRVPAHELLLELLGRLGGPLAVSSANRHGEPAATTADQVRDAFGADIAVVVDGGLCEGSPSTVVDCTAWPPRVLREGRLPAAELVADP